MYNRISLQIIIIVNQKRRWKKVVIFGVLATPSFRRFWQNPRAGWHMRPLFPASRIKRLWMNGSLSWVSLRKLVLGVRSRMSAAVWFATTLNSFTVFWMYSGKRAYRFADDSGPVSSRSRASSRTWPLMAFARRVKESTADDRFGSWG